MYRVLRYILEPERKKQETGENYIMRSVMILNHLQILLGLLNEGGLDVWGMWNAGE